MRSRGSVLLLLLPDEDWPLAELRAGACGIAGWFAPGRPRLEEDGLPASCAACCMILSSGRYSMLLPPFGIDHDLAGAREDFLHGFQVQAFSHDLRRLRTR